MTPTTAQIMTENTVSQTYRATYSPDDNKYGTHHYGSMKKRIPDQQSRLSLGAQTGTLCGASADAGAGGMSCFPSPVISRTGTARLFDRQEQRAGRFSDYSDRRAVESEQALAHVDSLASAVPLGQPIVGHHSERRARRHAQKIENGMKRAVMLFERARYWEQRAQASAAREIQGASGCALPPYQKIEAELRKSQSTLPGLKSI
ncbi:DUF3560 domain-containing protein [Klebsiella pneumoniae]|uniref:DUF3560 domain-containing protein n=1 Tax=Klebsiella pneumoniae TaxID=573 RepID=UPI00294A7FFC|nr:DUF3560 domain-containing protein [Klebsiella pneumoniae]MDV5423421.1 DUF3560 domain-containing protein [Klebsiella pneumoniae]